MKHNLLLLSVFSLFFLIGCNSEDKFKESVNLEENHIVEVTLEDVSKESRVGFIIPGGDFFWSDGDMLGIEVSKSNGSRSIKNFSILDGHGTNFAKFSGITQIGETMGHYAVFPFYKRSRHRITSTDLIFRYPTEYVYTKVDQKFPARNMSVAELAELNGFNPAMAGEIVNKRIHLKHLGGTICVLIENMPYSAGSLYFKTNNKITGEYTISLDQIKNIGTEQFEGFRATSTSEAKEKTVKIRFTNAEVGKPGHFYIPAPIGKYTEYSVGIDTNDDQKLDVVYSSKAGFEVKRTFTKLLRLQPNINSDGWDIGIDGWINEDIDYGGTVR